MLMAQAEKATQANLIKRREETVATRSLLNTASVLVVFRKRQFIIPNRRTIFKNWVSCHQEIYFLMRCFLARRVVIALSSSGSSGATPRY
ncbi:MAG: hypothetical protein DRQ49_02130 [Gammaproteobacteria bacterium]|nr:MAG: hypothetical protein DRQ49_02130 [Gammaproteobacteria bacterium]RKZ43637.1 MAG: hypothetical protein DRQ41_04815 [Gammaproteobacteria bacterium]RKZ77252.1 MAG: hypothetical protein DRQ57_00760 [Gammaproteobacteria bacterium]